MQTKLLKNEADKIHALIFDKGDEVIDQLESFARERKISSAHFTAIGAFSDVVLGYFDWEKKDYIENRINDQVEVITLAGDIGVKAGKPKVHAHVVIGKRDATALGGHLLRVHVRPTLELMLTETPGPLKRRSDPETVLALIDV